MRSREVVEEEVVVMVVEEEEVVVVMVVMCLCVCVGGLRDGDGYKLLWPTRGKLRCHCVDCRVRLLRLLAPSWSGVVV